MARELALNDVVTAFLLNTCRIRAQASIHGVQAALLSGQLATAQVADEVDSEIIPFTTGSVAEFYIEPMLPCIGDVDIMFHHNTELAIPGGHPPPTHLPAEFHNYIRVFEIIPSHLPGCVYLQLRYLLTECRDNNYKAVQYDRELLTYRDNIYDIHRPSTLHFSSQSMTMLSVDFVSCIRCPMWPLQAADWPTRHRDCGWPDSATLERVVSNGCYVVGVAHRQCRQHEWIGKHQWRLSFSRAEITLLNSWMPVGTTDCLSHVTIFHKDRAINRLC